MGRPFYSHELDDPDLDWLVSNFLDERPDFITVDVGTLPLILMPYRELVTPEVTTSEALPLELEE